MSALQPHGDYVVAVTEKASNKTASGIYIPEKSQQKSQILQAVAVGPDVKKVKVGDKFACKSFSTNEITLEQDEYVLVKDEDIMATVK
jgi:chaperonin GroES